MGYSSDTIKYLADHMTRIWACNLTEGTLKVNLWYPLFLWMVVQKGQQYRNVRREEEVKLGIDIDEEEEEEERSGDGDDDDDDDGDEEIDDGPPRAIPGFQRP